LLNIKRDFKAWDFLTRVFSINQWPIGPRFTPTFLYIILPQCVKISSLSGFETQKVETFCILKPSKVFTFQVMKCENSTLSTLRGKWALSGLQNTESENLVTLFRIYSQKLENQKCGKWTFSELQNTESDNFLGFDTQKVFTFGVAKHGKL